MTLSEQLQPIFDESQYPKIGKFTDLVRAKYPTISKHDIRKWYNSQEINQLFIKPNIKSKLDNHYQVTIPNERHEADLLFLPSDKGFRYALVVVDTASRYKAVIPLKKKSDALDGYKQIIAKSHLQLPKNLITDMGGEFRNNLFANWCKDNKIQLSHNTPGNHLAFVESFNRVLGNAIFRRQFQNELISGRTSKSWVDSLPSILKTENSKKNIMTQLTPMAAVKLSSVKQEKTVHNLEDTLQLHDRGTQVRRLLNSDEIYDIPSDTITIGRKRATDPNWSRKVYTVSRIVKGCPQCLNSHFLDGYKHPLNYWQLMPV